MRVYVRVCVCMFVCVSMPYTLATVACHDGTSLAGLQGAYIHQMLHTVLASAVRCRSRV